jgi:hypothetical protein
LPLGPLPLGSLPLGSLSLGFKDHPNRRFHLPYSLSQQYATGLDMPLSFSE